MSLDYLESNEFLADLFRGDRRAANTLFDAYFQKLQVFAFQFTDEEFYAEDIASRCLTTLIMNPGRFDLSTVKLKNLVNWLFVAVRNASLDHRKSFANKVKKASIEIGEELVSAESDIEHEIIKSEVIFALYEGLKLLPKERRQVLELLYYDKASYSEAAAIMGISITTLKAYRKDGFRRMRQFMTKEQFIYALTLVCDPPLLNDHQSLNKGQTTPGGPILPNRDIYFEKCLPK